MNNKFHPYKVKLCQEINDDDPDRRLYFGEELLEQIDSNIHFTSMMKQPFLYTERSTTTIADWSD